MALKAPHRTVPEHRTKLLLAAALASLAAWPASADPAAELRRLDRSGGATPAAVAAALDEGLAGLEDAPAGRPPAERAAEAYAAAEWFRLAAGLDPDAGHAEEALQRFRALRLDFRSEPTGWLGYLGEARVLRETGRPGEAMEVLATLRNAGGVPDAVRALAEREALEVTLATDPEAAYERASAAGESWVAARAAAALDKPGDAAAAARRAEGDAPEFERLALLHATGEATAAERAARARQLVGVGRTEEALTLLDAEPEADPALRARLLTEAGRWAEAAAAWEAAGGEEAPWLAAVCRVKAEAAGGGGDPAATRAALDAALASGLPDDRRGLALTWWADRSEPAAVAQRLAEEPGLVAADPGLRYRLLAARLATEDVPPDAAETLAEVRDAAGEGLGSLAAAAALTRARLLGADDARAGLNALDADAALLAAEPATAEAAARLRVDLGVAAGLVDAASEAVAANPDAASPAATITLAEALAERGDAAGAVRLAASAVAREPGDDALAERAAAVAASVDAWADAARLADAVDTPGAQALRARALLELGRKGEAEELVDGLTGPEAARIRAAFALRGGRPAEAAGEARAARAAAAPGDPGWWEATLLLAEALRSGGDAAGVADLLRVAAVLHPPPDRGTLRARVDAARSAPEASP